MNRGLVLIGCLAAAGAVAAYTHRSQEASEQTPVFTVHAPVRSSDPAPSSPPPIPRMAATPADRVSLIRELQRELRRVGCYNGEVNGVWTTSSRMAMKSFTDQANASLPIDDPDHVLLSLVRGHKDTACGGSAKAPAEAAPTQAKTESGSDRSTPAPSAVVSATATAAGALAGSAAIARGAPDAGPLEDRSRAAAGSPDKLSTSDRSERRNRYSDPAPSERVYTRRSRRYSNSSRPPKFVRNVLRAFGIR